MEYLVIIHEKIQNIDGQKGHKALQKSTILSKKTPLWTRSLVARSIHLNTYVVLEILFGVYSNYIFAIKICKNA